MDGSLGILYRHEGKFKIATRGSFDSEQALWATEFLRAYYNLKSIEPNITLLFEIIYPDNRIVVDYGREQALYLIGARHKVFGNYSSDRSLREASEYFGFPLPERYNFKNTQSIIDKLSTLPYNNEGWVVEFEDGQRFKFKGQEYLTVHRLIHNISFKNTAIAYRAGKIDELRAVIPDEFLNDIDSHIAEIEDKIFKVKYEVESIFNKINRTASDRREFAACVMTSYKEYAPYLFLMLDNKPLTSAIYKLEFGVTDQLVENYVNESSLNIKE